eukprot:TRINITY_DN8952_c0_g1_i3.p1 TRINITY_DN8952_c0_g1~~TRINITY_DN8952_c0_g1_i3.p1  ORF type:complete len:242 (+),score=21.32 TRINITY_DN8952_c0_g1_i3:63-788(+)
MASVPSIWALKVSCLLSAAAAGSFYSRQGPAPHELKLQYSVVRWAAVSSATILVVLDALALGAAEVLPWHSIGNIVAGSLWILIVSFAQGFSMVRTVCVVILAAGGWTMLVGGTEFPVAVVVSDLQIQRWLLILCGVALCSSAVIHAQGGGFCGRSKLGHDLAYVIICVQLLLHVIYGALCDSTATASEGMVSQISHSFVPHVATIQLLLDLLLVCGGSHLLLKEPGNTYIRILARPLWSA